jgi:hypothetical protein
MAARIASGLCAIFEPKTADVSLVASRDCQSCRELKPISWLLIPRDRFPSIDPTGERSVRAAAPSIDDREPRGEAPSATKFVCERRFTSGR